MSLYNCRHSGDQYKITKFDTDWNVEASYLCDLVACECPAGHRPSCRHRQMLPKFIQREHIGDEWFFDFDRGGWVQGASRDVEPEIITPQQLLDDPHEFGQNALVIEPSQTIVTQREILIGDTDTDWESSLASAGLDQASEQEPSPNQAITYTSEGSPPLASRTTIRRRV